MWCHPDDLQDLVTRLSYTPPVYARNTTNSKDVNGKPIEALSGSIDASAVLDPSYVINIADQLRIAISRKTQIHFPTLYHALGILRSFSLVDNVSLKKMQRLNNTASF